MANRLLKMDKLALVELLDKLTDENIESTKRAEDLSKANAEMVLATHELEEKARQAAEQLAEAKAALLALQEAHLAVSEKLSKAEGEVATLNQILAATQAEGKVLRREFTGIQQSLTSAQAEIADLTDRLTQAETERDALRETLEKMPRDGKARVMPAAVAKPVQPAAPPAPASDAQEEITYLRRQLALKEEECTLLRSKLIDAKPQEEGSAEFRIAHMTDVMLSAQDLFRKVLEASDQCMERTRVLLTRQQQEAADMIQAAEQRRDELVDTANRQAGEIIRQAQHQARETEAQELTIRRKLQMEMKQIAQLVQNMELPKEDAEHGQPDAAK